MPLRSICPALAPFVDALTADAFCGAEPLSAPLAHGFAALQDRVCRDLGAEDRHAAASFWSQVLFNRALVATLAIFIVDGRRAVLRPETLRCVFCPSSATPLRLMTVFEQAAGPETSAIDAVGDDLGRLIEALRNATGLGRRLLWENAWWPLVWAASELVRAEPRYRPAVEQAMTALAKRSYLRNLHWSGLDPEEEQWVGRRTCCLRHRLPGYAKCRGQCPLRAEDVVLA